MNSIPVLYEDDEIYVINKPAGLSVQGGQGVKHSLDNDFALQTGQKVYLVHRLDKDTSGLMIVAKSPFAASKWTKLISSKAVKKEYIAICAGKMKDKKGVITEKLIQHGSEKSAVTYFTVEEEKNFTTEIEGYENISLSFLRLKLETGRMHQIRIHLAKNGCPIAGDDQHGNFKLNKALKKALKIKSLLLASVRLTLPLNGRESLFEIELPPHMKIC
ncbi:Pseudouridylate synthase, 23S RNA-specific [Treponema sp. JC4]|uniref:RluA family pseudouridine synthase n=1 Tax=Treponema sp. JC4 TaxID=1124982 RepID=UPI00025B0E8B|nr:RluA family pseudouridine synthase [Treponema sp. JC4]EID84100.1 Pseudouridylate synthase, 23S RNA-specific [Treponema sp. JC4]